MLSSNVLESQAYLGNVNDLACNMAKENRLLEFAGIGKSDKGLVVVGSSYSFKERGDVLINMGSIDENDVNAKSVLEVFKRFSKEQMSIRDSEISLNGALKSIKKKLPCQDLIDDQGYYNFDEREAETKSQIEKLSAVNDKLRMVNAGSKFSSIDMIDAKVLKENGINSIMDCFIKVTSNEVSKVYIEPRDREKYIELGLDKTYEQIVQNLYIDINPYGKMNEILMNNSRNIVGLLEIKKDGEIKRTKGIATFECGFYSPIESYKDVISKIEPLLKGLRNIGFIYKNNEAKKMAEVISEEINKRNEVSTTFESREVIKTDKISLTLFKSKVMIKMSDEVLSWIETYCMEHE